MAEESLKITLTVENKAALAALQQTIKGLDGVEFAGAKAGGAAGKMGKDFTGLSRVIQDLPYGFNAISNNLTQLLPAAGAAGLAFSGIVTALTFAQIGFGSWTRGIGGATQATQEATKANEEYLAGLAKEKTQLDLLFRSATNDNLSKQVRLEAVKNLRNEYGAYLQDFTDEEILAGKATKAYDLLSSSIIKAAKARAAQSLIEAKQLEKLKLEQEIAAENTIKENTKANIKPYVAPTTMGAVGEIRTVAKQQETADAAFISRTKDKTEAIKKLDLEMKNLGKTYDENLVKQLKQPPPPPGAGGGENIDGKFQNYMNNMKALLPILERFKAANAAVGTQAPIPLAPQRNTGRQDLQNLQLSVESNRTLNKLMAERAVNQDIIDKKIQESQAGQITDYLTNSFAGLVTAMQNGASLGDALGSMFQRLATDIAMAAAKALILQGILALLPVGGFAASGSGVVRAFGKLLGFSQGGTVSGPQSGYPVMLHGTEHIVRPDQMKSIIASASQMGGSGASRVVVEGRIRGNDIFLSQQRTGTFRSLTT